MRKLNTKNTIQLIRHTSQAIFFIFLVFLVAGSICSFSVGWLNFTEPLGSIQILLSNITTINNLRIVLLIISGALIFILITVILGRAWCGWACPVGSIIELGEYIFTKTKIKKYHENNKNGKNTLNRNTKHAVLGGVLTSAIVSRNPAWCEICPIGTICRTTSAGGFIALAEATIIGGVLASSLYKKRFFCKYICPVSSLLAIISKLNLFIKPVVDRKSCKNCAVCEKICPEDIPLYRQEELAECTKCLECYSRCPHGSVRIKAASSKKTSKKDITVLTLTIVLLATFISFSYIVTAPQETNLIIYPEKFTISPGETVILTAKLISSDGKNIYNSNIYWWSSEGFFNNSIGHTVIFTAPQLNENKTVEIRAIFYGDEMYLPSSASTTIQVMYIKKELTKIVIEPSNFIIKSNENITLRAITSPLDLPGELIRWKLIGPGKLSDISGRTVTYYPPEEIQEQIRINITVTFEGDIRYLPSVSYASGLIVPKQLEKTPTILTINPSDFTINQGENITLRATLKTLHGEEVEGAIKWRLEGIGSLSTTVGRETVYHAPKTGDKVYVKIVAYFEGSDKYLPSENATTGLIIGEIPFIQELYEARFKKMTFEDVTLMEKINVGNLTLTILKAGIIVAENIEIIKLGLTSRKAVLNDTEFYLTYLTGEVGEAIINLEDFKKGSRQKIITVENGLIIFAKLRCREAEFYNLSIIGEYIGGEEPYIPLIVTGKETVLSGGYYIDAPKTYGELVNKVMELTSSRIDVRNFSIVKPTNYQLDRTLKRHQYSGKLLLNSSKIIGENVAIYSIYYKVIFRISTYIRYFGEYTVEATGDIDIRRAIFHFWIGFEIGRICHAITSVEVHTVYFKLDKTLIQNLILSSILEK